MKKSLLSTVLVSVMLMTANICKADIVDSSIAGNYKGSVVIDLGEGPSDSMEDQKVSIVIEDDMSTIQFTLYGFTFAPVINNENIVLDGVPVEEAIDGTFTIGNEEYAKDLALGGGVVQATVKFDSENSYIDGDDIKVSLNITWNNVVFKVYFEGAKDATGIISNTVNSVSSSVKFDANANMIMSSDLDSSEYAVYSSEGSLVKMGSFINGAASVAELPNGLYLVKAGTATTKLIKR